MRWMMGARITQGEINSTTDFVHAQLIQGIRERLAKEANLPVEDIEEGMIPADMLSGLRDTASKIVVNSIHCNQ